MGGTPKWMVYMGNPTKSLIFGNLLLYCYYYPLGQKWFADGWRIDQKSPRMKSFRKAWSSPSNGEPLGKLLGRSRKRLGDASPL